MRILDAMYELRFDKNAENVYKKVEVNLVRRLNRCFEHLRENLYRESEQVVNILQIVHRGSAYR